MTVAIRRKVVENDARVTLDVGLAVRLTGASRMAAGARLTMGHRWRAALTVVALVAHLVATTGVPLPVPPSHYLKVGPSFPCQNLPCGCLSAELCWAGDCCCYTLEEKLAWAEANGVEPPTHVRPAVEARRDAPKKPKKECCRESGGTPVAECCEQSFGCDASKPQTTLGEVKQTPTDSTGIGWVLGMYAKKCRGLGPDGLLHLDPVVFPTPVVPELVSGPLSFDWPLSEHCSSVSSPPPVPPPVG